MNIGHNTSASVQEAEMKKYGMSIVQKIDSSLDRGTTKYLLRLSGGNFIECVLLRFPKKIFQRKRFFSLCVSSQIGCRVNCGFCATGKDKFRRNMTSQEIINQVRIVQDDLIRSGKDVIITSVSFMGMGEPLLNYDNVLDAIKFLYNHKDYPNLHFSLSTSGIIPKMYQLADENLPIFLYLSLHSTTDIQRKKIMPYSISNIEELLSALEYYSKKGHPESKACISYLLFKDINDSVDDAHRLVKLVGKRKFHVSLKTYCDNNFPGFTGSSIKTFESFRKILRKNKVETGVIISFGTDIFSGCGQLRQRKLLEKKEIKRPFTFTPLYVFRSAKDLLATTYHIIKTRK